MSFEIYQSTCCKCFLIVSSLQIRLKLMASVIRLQKEKCLRHGEYKNMMMSRRTQVNLNNMGLICVGRDINVKENYFKISDLLIVEIDNALFCLFQDISIFPCRITQLILGFSDCSLIRFITEIALICTWLFMTPKVLLTLQRGNFGVLQPLYPFLGSTVFCTLVRTSMDCSSLSVKLPMY